MRHFMPQLQEMHPKVDENQLKKIIKEGCANLFKLVLQSKDIRLESRKAGIKFLIYRRKHNYTKLSHNRRIRNQKPEQLNPDGSK